ncbi:hypothetical protein F4779DRAFT_619640 [Xylariaceae sp. FL0662B]|nr:hypothetical protein F4779DRAFT_619640 [Xylariaceae sp. FL0662B]
MGNSSSTEAPKRGPRTAQKLTKPRTGNPGTAGLLSPNGRSGTMRHSSSIRRSSVSHGSSPGPSPGLPERNAIATASLSDDKAELAHGDRANRRLSRSSSIQEPPTYHQRSQSLGVVPSSRDLRLSRANSLVVGYEGSPNHSQVRIQGNLSRNGSRTSVNYDPCSYESKRLLNLVEEPSYSDNSTASANPSQMSDAEWRIPKSRQPSISGTTPLMTRDNSETSLYTPMRRKSLVMTPGVATRTARIDPIPSMSRTRQSLPSTPARRDSIESMSVGPTYFPPLPADAEPIPRVVTPCEAEYKQTGVFKLGTLRITNGSPVRSPMHDSSGEGKETEGHKQSFMDRPAKNCFGTDYSAANDDAKNLACTTATEKANAQSTSNSLSSIIAPCPMRVPRNSTPTMASQEQPTEPEIPPQFLPGHPPSPLLLDEDKMGPLELQTTSKHTAVEDELFETEENEYSSAEILDVRIDPNAKSLPPLPKVISESELSRGIGRSDSGIVGSQSSKCSRKEPLSKADSGYSSNISLRSLSSKPTVTEKTHPSETAVESAANAVKKDTTGSGQPKNTSPTVLAPKPVFPRSSREAPPLPVAKDHTATTTTSSSKASSELSPLFRQNFRLLAFGWASESAPSPSSTGSKMGNTRESLKEVSSLSATGSATSNSTLSISNASRKPGKLQRLLSSSRTPLAVHNIHPTEKAGVPSVPKDVQAKLEARAGLLPISVRRFTLKSEASRETLGTILSVGSAELSQDTDVTRVLTVPDQNAKGSRGALEAAERKQAMSASSIGSTIANPTSSVSAKRPIIIRKPVPVRDKPHDLQQESARRLEGDESNSRPSDMSHTAVRRSLSREADGLTLAATAKEGDDYSAGRGPTIQSSIVTGPLNENPRAPVELSRLGNEEIQRKPLPVTSLEIPPTVSNASLPRTPPPVSMRNRNKNPRASPVPRSYSTPPEAIRVSGELSVSRRESREDIHSYPPADHSLSQHGVAMSRKSSRENTRSCPPARAQLGPNSSYMVFAEKYDQRVSFQHKFPNWEVQTDHDTSTPRLSSSEYTRLSSLSSQSSQRNLALKGKGLQPQQPQHSNVRLLRRQSSYDSCIYVPRDSYVQDNGPYPSISRNGQMYATDPRSGRLMPMAQQWDQFGQYPPYVPRGHHRHRSMDQYGKAAPYRVLHSYNSPAYRNVPIWG